MDVIFSVHSAAAVNWNFVYRTTKTVWWRIGTVWVVVVYRLRPQLVTQIYIGKGLWYYYNKISNNAWGGRA